MNDQPDIPRPPGPRWYFMQPFKNRGCFVMVSNPLINPWNFHLNNENAEIIKRWLPAFDPDKANLSALEALMLTEFRLSPVDVRELNWPQVIALLQSKEPPTKEGELEIRRKKQSMGIPPDESLLQSPSPEEREELKANLRSTVEEKKGRVPAETAVTLKEFMKQCCEPLRDAKLYGSKVKSLQREARRHKARIALPEPVNTPDRGRTNYYLPSALKEAWPSCCQILPYLPKLKV